MRQAYVGFYWTLPVARRPFRKSTTDVEEAAKRSRTIRYQLTVINRYVIANKADLVGEAAFFELATDRGTRHVEDELAKVAAICTAHSATLLYVDFSLYQHWRPHPFMMGYLKKHGVPTEPLPPDEATIDTEDFDPVKHFRKWQRRQASEAEAMRAKAGAELQAVLAGLPPGHGRYQAAANELNRLAIMTATGRAWTAEGVRKTHARYSRAD